MKWLDYLYHGSTATCLESSDPHRSGQSTVGVLHDFHGIKAKNFQVVGFDHDTMVSGPVLGRAPIQYCLSQRYVISQSDFHLDVCQFHMLRRVPGAFSLGLCEVSIL